MGETREKARKQNILPKAVRHILSEATPLTAEEKIRLSEEPIIEIAGIVERHDSWQQEAMRQTMRL